MNNKTKWRLKMSEQILYGDNITSGLERLAINYVPNNVWPVIDNKTYSNHQQYCKDYFLDRYNIRREQANDEVTSTRLAVYDTVKRVLEIRDANVAQH